MSSDLHAPEYESDRPDPADTDAVEARRQHFMGCSNIVTRCILDGSPPHHELAVLNNPSGRGREIFGELAYGAGSAPAALLDEDLPTPASAPTAASTEPLPGASTEPLPGSGETVSSALGRWKHFLGCQRVVCGLSMHRGAMALQFCTECGSFMPRSDPRRGVLSSRGGFFKAIGASCAYVKALRDVAMQPGAGKDLDGALASLNARVHSLVSSNLSVAHAVFREVTQYGVPGAGPRTATAATGSEFFLSPEERMRHVMGCMQTFTDVRRGKTCIQVVVCPECSGIRRCIASRAKRFILSNARVPKLMRYILDILHEEYLQFCSEIKAVDKPAVRAQIAMHLSKQVHAVLHTDERIVLDFLEIVAHPWLIDHLRDRMLDSMHRDNHEQGECSQDAPLHPGSPQRMEEPRRCIEPPPDARWGVQWNERRMGRPRPLVVLPSVAHGTAERGAEHRVPIDCSFQETPSFSMATTMHPVEPRVLPGAEGAEGGVAVDSYIPPFTKRRQIEWQSTPQLACDGLASVASATVPLGASAGADVDASIDRVDMGRLAALLQVAGHNSRRALVERLGVGECERLLLWEPALPEEAQGALAGRLGSLLGATQGAGECLRRLVLYGRGECCGLLVGHLDELACLALLDMVPAPPAAVLGLLEARLLGLVGLRA